MKDNYANAAKAKKVKNVNDNWPTFVFNVYILTYPKICLFHLHFAFI